MKPSLILTAVAITALTPSIAAEDSGFFIAGQVGKAKLSDDLDGFEVDTDSTAYRFAAGWRFNENFALEGGYNRLGDFDQAFNNAGTLVAVSLGADGFTLGGIGTLPLSERFEIYLRVGAFFWDGDAEINNISAAEPEDTNLYFGAGLRVDLTKDMGVNVEATKYDLDGTSSTVLSLGLDYRF